MRISKTFRLSEEAVAILESKQNASRFIEDLILKGGEGISRGESMILDRLEKLELQNKSAPQIAQITGEALHVPPIKLLESKGMFSGKNEGFMTIGNQPQVMNILTPALTPADMIAEIKNLETARDDELEWCQDAREIKRIKDEYQVKIDEAWKVFHSLKEIA